MKQFNKAISVIVIATLFIVSSFGSYAQTKPATPILDDSSAASLSLAFSMLGAEVALNGGSYIYKMDSTVVASAATGDYASLISRVLESIKFEYSSPEYIKPVVIKYLGSDCCVFRFATSSVFNENRFTDRELAQRICTDKVLPVFYNMSKSFEANCPRYIGVGVAYQSKDFTEKYSLGDRHALVIIASKENIKKLFTYEITDNKFLENSFILLYNGSDAKRIEIKF